MPTRAAVVGWALSRWIDTELTLAALTMALTTRRPAPGLIHHSDRGVQYASGDYVTALATAEARISMAARGNPYENAKAESFFKTLKHEEVYLKEYRTFRRRGSEPRMRSLTTCTTRSDCIRAWAICHRSSSKPR